MNGSRYAKEVSAVLTDRISLDNCTAWDVVAMGRNPPHGLFRFSYGGGQAAGAGKFGSLRRLDAAGPAVSSAERWTETKGANRPRTLSKHSGAAVG